MMIEKPDESNALSPHEITSSAVEWLFEHAVDPLFLTRTDGAILRANAAATKALRMSEAEICAQGRGGILASPDALPRILEEREKAGMARGELLIRRGDGSTFLAEVTTAILPLHSGPLSYVMLRDLTEREEAARSLRESEQRYAAVYEKAPIPILLLRLSNAQIVSVNEAFLSLFEFDLHEVVCKTPLEINLSETSSWEKLRDRLAANATIRDQKIVRKSRSGKQLVLSVNVEAVTIQGEPHALAIFVDNTTRDANEQTLRANEERLSLFVTQAPTSIAVFDRNMNFLAYSRKFILDFDLPHENLVGNNHYVVFPDLPDEIKAVHRRCLAGATETSDESPLVLANGNLEWYRWEMVPWYDTQGTIGGVVLFTERITELKKAREQIAEQERLLEEVIDGSRSLIAAFGHDGRVMFANKAVADLLGKKKAELVGTPVSHHLPKNRAENFMSRHIEVMRTGEPQVLETTLPTKHGEISILASRYPIRDTHGVIYGTASIMTDISQQKRIEAELRKSEENTREALAELEKALDATRRTEEKFRHAQKMEAVGRLAGGIAHDFNNLLTVILGNSSEVLAGLRPADPLHEIISEIEKAGQRAAGLTRQLLAFSRKQVLEPRIVNVNELITGSEKMIQRIVGEDIELTLLLDPRPLPCKLDKGQFEQVLLNLVVNARDAMADGGRLTIESACVMLDAEHVAAHSDMVPGEHVRITVSDTGVGIPKEAQPHIFEPFFTTKDIGKGTGLGLSTAYGIIRQSGGTIWLYSEPGQGTTFKIYFPKQNEGAPENASTNANTAKTRGKETILVVEDDEQVRNTLSGILRRAGYHVMTGSNGGEALLICEQHESTIHLLLTDVIMPKLNGRKLSERLHQIRPAMRVIFMSGYTENVVMHHGILDANLEFIAKPITTDVLLAKVREVLDRSFS